MRWWAVLPVTIFLFSGCAEKSGTGANPVAAAPVAVKASSKSKTVPASAASMLATLNNYLAAWNAHDSAKAVSFLSEDSEYFDAAFAGKQAGRAAIEENAIGVFLRGMPDLHWEMRSEPIIGVNGIAYEWTLTGTNTGTWGGIPATRQKISLKGMSFVRFRGGKISYQAVIYDSATLNRQLGL